MVLFFNQALLDDGLLLDVLLLFGHAVLSVVLDELGMQNVQRHE